MRAGISLLLWTGLAAPALAGADTPAVAPGTDLFGVALNLLMVIGLILVLAWGLRRYQSAGGGVSGAIRVVAALPLGTRDRVVLIEVGGEQILVGVSAGRMERLHVLEQPVSTGSAVAAETGFAQRLRDAVRGTPR